MKKIVMGLLVITCLAVFMTGCTEKKEVNGTTETENSQEKYSNEESEKIFTAFSKIVEEKDALQAKEFILDNIENVDEEMADRMVVEYEKLLNTEFKDLFEKYISETYYNAVNETMDEEYVLNLEKIKDEEIKEEVMHMVASGYTFEMLEGSYYLAIDYAMIHDTFSQYLSENLKPYYELRKREFQHPIFVEEVVSVDFSEVKDRVTTLEKAIRDNEELAKRSDVKDLMKWYIQALLTVDYFNNAVNYETGEVIDTVNKVYEELEESDLKIAKHAAEEMNKLLTELQYILKPDDEEAYRKVNTLKFKISDEVGNKIEEYYFTK